MTIKEYVELENLKQRLKEINQCINRCNRYGNKEDEFLLVNKYRKPVKHRIRQLELKKCQVIKS